MFEAASPKQLKTQSTWRLLGLSIITLGIYPAHYINRITRSINRHLDTDDRVPVDLTRMILFITWGSVFLVLYAYLIAPMTMAPNNMLALGIRIVWAETMLRWFDILWLLFIIYWAFDFRSRLHLLLEIEQKDPRRLSPIWTVLFTFLYVNYKINKLAAEEA